MIRLHLVTKVTLLYACVKNIHVGKCIAGDVTNACALPDSSTDNRKVAINISAVITALVLGATREVHLHPAPSWDEYGMHKLQRAHAV